MARGSRIRTLLLSLSTSPLYRLLWLSLPFPLILLDSANAAALPAPAEALRPLSLVLPQLATTSLPVTTAFASVAPAMQTTTTDAKPATGGIILSDLLTPGNPSKQPFPTPSDIVPTTSIDVSSLSASPLLSVLTDSPLADKADILKIAISTDAPPSQFPTRDDHPVKPAGIGSRSGPLQTNKFYDNLLLGDQREPIWPQPYSLTWAKGGDVGRGGLANSWGFSVSNIEREGLHYGDPVQAGEAPKFFAAPLYVQSVVLSATELGADTLLTTDSHAQFSLNVNFLKEQGGKNLITFPVVQGMGFVSALYTEATPLLQSALFFTDLNEAGDVDGGKTFKWRVKLKDGTNWLLYVTPNGGSGRPPLVLKDSSSITGPENFSGLIQVAKNNADGCGEEVYDSSAGAYPTSASTSGSVDGTTGTYSFTWTRAGSTEQKLLMFALPHHVDSMAPDTLEQGSCLALWTTTKGQARGFRADAWSLEEKNLPSEIDFDPWRPDLGAIRKVADSAATQINDAAANELGLDIDKLTNLDSAYYGGKALSKFALIIYAVNKLGGQSALAASGLEKLEAAMGRWIDNKQTWPLAYDPVWGGLVSTASYEGRDQGYDFGNTLYNDHHFHYGYFVHAAAVIANLNPDWLKQGSNKVWVDTLVRDFANPDAGDPFFPSSRAFDWFNGHSWATGIFATPDGKNQESTSEDGFAAYGMKMWGRVTGDANMEARGNLQLAIMRSSFNHYFYYDSENQVQPPKFTPNVVSGILFENKIDHTTFFGQSSEFTQGIHMLPISPVTAYLRPAPFVTHEWDTYFKSDIPLAALPDPNTGIIPPTGDYAGGHNCSSNINVGRLINCVDVAWRGILMGNLAQIDAKTSWGFFADQIGAGWDWMWVAGSGSRTWYLAYAAAFGGTG